MDCVWTSVTDFFAINLILTNKKKIIKVSSWEHISDLNVISSSNYIPSRWVSDLQDVSSVIYPWPERMGTTLGPTE